MIFLFSLIIIDYTMSLCKKINSMFTQLNRRFRCCRIYMKKFSWLTLLPLLSPMFAQFDPLIHPAANFPVAMLQFVFIYGTCIFFIIFIAENMKNDFCYSCASNNDDSSTSCWARILSPCAFHCLSPTRFINHRKLF